MQNVYATKFAGGSGESLASRRPGGLESARHNHFLVPGHSLAIHAIGARQGMRMAKRKLAFGVAVSAFSLSCGWSPGRTQDRNQGRSMVISRNGIVAAESPLAVEAGVRILEQGGNAVDAAIATNAMMGVVEPMMNGIGGDLFAIGYDAQANKLYGLNASGWAPKTLTIEVLQKQGLKEMPQKGSNAGTGPGAVEGRQK